MITEIGLLSLFMLAFVNGANDVSKSIAPTVAALTREMTTKRPIKALLWGTAFSGIGCSLAFYISRTLFTTFTEGLVNVAPTSSFAFAVITGASGWVLIATILRLPVSTTHAIVGAVVFAGAFEYGVQRVQWASLGPKVLLPLALSPLIAFIACYVLGKVSFRRSTLLTQRSNDRNHSLIESSNEEHVATLGHWVSAATVATARGLNDAPKMAAFGYLLLTGLSGATGLSYVVITVAVVLGSIIGGMRVTETLAKKVTTMDNIAAFEAGSVTAGLVSLGAFSGVPMSTTHVSTGAIVGIGAEQRTLSRRVVRDIILAWLVTLPMTGIISTVLLLVIH